jgi:hypothetical protein
MKFLLDNYEEYKRIQSERGIDDMKLIFQKTKNKIISQLSQHILSKKIKNILED